MPTGMRTERTPLLKSFHGSEFRQECGDRWWWLPGGPGCARWQTRCPGPVPSSGPKPIQLFRLHQLQKAASRDRLQTTLLKSGFAHASEPCIPIPKEIGPRAGGQQIVFGGDGEDQPNPAHHFRTKAPATAINADKKLKNKAFLGFIPECNKTPKSPIS